MKIIFIYIITLLNWSVNSSNNHNIVKKSTISNEESLNDLLKKFKFALLHDGKQVTFYIGGNVSRYDVIEQVVAIKSNNGTQFQKNTFRIQSAVDEKPFLTTKIKDKSNQNPNRVVYEERLLRSDLNDVKPIISNKEIVVRSNDKILNDEILLDQEVVKTDFNSDLFNRIKSDLKLAESNLKSKLFINGTMCRYFKIDSKCVKVDYIPKQNNRYQYELDLRMINCKLIPRSSKRNTDLYIDDLSESEEWKPTILYRKKRSENQESDSLIVIENIINKTTVISLPEKVEMTIHNGLRLIRRYFNILPLCPIQSSKSILNYFDCVCLEISIDYQKGCLRYPHCRSAENSFDLDQTNCVTNSNKCSSPITFIYGNEICSSFSLISNSLDEVNVNDGIDACGFRNPSTQEYVELKHCKDISKVAIALPVTIIIDQNRSYLLRRSDIKLVQNPKLIDFYDCKKECSDGSCRGDEFYLEHFKGGDSKEFCKMRKNYGFYNLLHNGVAYNITCFYSGLAKVYFEEKFEQKLNLNLVSFSCKDGLLYYNIHDIGVKFFKACKERACLVVSNVTSMGMIRIPNIVSYFGGWMEIELHNRFNLDVDKISVECKAADICKINDCFMCQEKWVSYHCFGPFEWLVYLLTILIIIFIALLMIKLILSMLLKASPIIRPCKICLGWFLFRCFKGTKTIRTASYIKLSQMESELMASSISKNKVKNYKKPYTPNLSIVVITLFMFLGFGSTLNCELHEIMSISQKDCIDGICSVRGSSRLVLNNKGSSSCLRFVNNDDITPVVIEIKVVELSLVCSKEFQYYHPVVKVNCKSQSLCYKSGICNDYACSKTTRNTSLDVFIREEQFIGFNGCGPRSGCAGNGCFYCVDGCIFYRVFFSPTNENPFEVNRCSSWFYSVGLNITKSDVNGFKQSTIVLSPGSTISLDKVDYNMVSLNFPPLTHSNKCFISNGNVVGLAECNSRGTTNKGNIGEIQCNSEHDAKRSSTACIFGNNLVNHQLNLDSITCDSSIINPLLSIKESRLPLLTEEGIYKMQNKNLKIELINDVSLEVQIDVNNLKIEQISDKATCYVTVKNFDGCYSCSLNSRIKISIKTSRGSSTATIKCPSSKGVVILSATESEIMETITMAFDKSNINEECVVSCSGGDSSFKLKGKLDFIPLTPTGKDESVVYLDTHSNNFDYFSLLQSDWLLSIIGTISLLFVFLVILKLLKYFILSRSNINKRK